MRIDDGERYAESEPDGKRFRPGDERDSAERTPAEADAEFRFAESRLRSNHEMERIREISEVARLREMAESERRLRGEDVLSERYRLAKESQELHGPAAFSRLRDISLAESGHLEKLGLREKELVDNEHYTKLRRENAVSHHPQTAANPQRSRFMITDILSGQGGPHPPAILGRSPCSSPASSAGDGPRDLSVHCRDPVDSDDHESGTDSGIPGEGSSVCSNGKCGSSTWNLRVPTSSARITGGS
ncbi:UNVERIFIED_CONTAM: hypothetical protein PYX00_003700 [Menopon gallinae]|uniref:Uncharacterized protein n=1 Tax=Menopon gallinae TaxID=328185 RepID=A0AAW2I0Y4_9NEOP